MQPNQQPQHPIDYLDSISSSPKGSGQPANDKLFFGVIIFGILSVVAVGILVLVSGGSSPKEDLSRLSVRLDNLQTVSDSSQKNIVSSDLRGTNTNLSLSLANANRDIEETLNDNGIDPDKISSKITDQENTDELTEKLEDARLNAIFDRIYAREMSYQLETLIVLLEQIEGKTKKDSEKEYLETTLKNIEPLQEQFADFNAATS